MNKKRIFTLLPTILCFGVLSGCKGGNTPTPTPTPGKTLTKIEVKPSQNTYTVGYEFAKSDIGSFQAYYSDSSTVSIKEGYTSDPELPYTFKDDDIADGKDFSFTYQEKTASFHVDVIKPTYPIDFDFSPNSDKNIDVDLNSTRQVQIKFKDSSYESNYKSIKWTYDSNYITKIEEKGKTFKFRAIQNTTINTTTDLKVTVVNKTETITKEQTCRITINEFDVKPMFYYQSWYSYLKEGSIDASTKFKFEAVLNGSNSVRYFGMSNYAGSTPYFTIGDSTKQISVTKVAITPSGGEETELIAGTGYDIYHDSSKSTNIYDLIYFKSPSYYSTKGTKIKIECTINSSLTEGIWAYFG